MNLPPDPEGDTAQSDHAQNDHVQSYSASSAQRDLMAALAVTFMSVPQGIAYAMIAGLPPARAGVQRSWHMRSLGELT